jgi:6-phosphogluconolactonase
MSGHFARYLQIGCAVVSVYFGIVALTARADERPLCSAANCGELVYIGAHAAGAGQGVSAARFDPRAGRLTALGLAAQAEQPTWLVVHPDKPVLYAVSEVGNDGKSEASVHSFRIDTKTGHLNPLNTVGSGGGGATHLVLDSKADTLFVANYGGGQISALPVRPDGALEQPSSVQITYGVGPTPRQQSPHPHGVTLDPSGRFVLAPDLGADRIFIYRIDPKSKTLTAAAKPFEATPPGSGPRHLVFTPNGRFAFLNTELDAQVRVYAWNAQAGRLRFLGSRPTAAPRFTGAKSAAGIAVSGDSRFLYVSNRGEDVLVVYAIDSATGALTEVQRLPCGGKNPTSLTLHRSGRWMLVANEASDIVTLFAVDPKSGRLAATGQALATPHPVKAAFFPG